LLDGDLVCACLVLAAGAPGSEITTLEGLQPANEQEMMPIQRALLEGGGVQCGFCTPGFVVAIHALLAEQPSPTPIEVQEALAGNLCRCTGYGRILAAVAGVVAGAQP
jgi:carbon-monoxide dehydrogenase small subunit